MHPFAIKPCRNFILLKKTFENINYTNYAYVLGTARKQEMIKRIEGVLALYYQSTRFSKKLIFTGFSNKSGLQ